MCLSNGIVQWLVASNRSTWSVEVQKCLCYHFHSSPCNGRPGHEQFKMHEKFLCKTTVVNIRVNSSIPPPIDPFSQPYLSPGHRGSRLSVLTATSSKSSSGIWAWPGVSPNLDVPGKPLKGDIQKSSLGVTDHAGGMKACDCFKATQHNNEIT